MDDGRWAMSDGPKGKGTPTPPQVARLHATLPIVTPYIALAAGTYDSSTPCWNILYVNRLSRHMHHMYHRAYTPCVQFLF